LKGSAGLFRLIRVDEWSWFGGHSAYFCEVLEPIEDYNVILDFRRLDAVGPKARGAKITRRVSTGHHHPVGPGCIDYPNGQVVELDGKIEGLPVLLICKELPTIENAEPSRNLHHERWFLDPRSINQTRFGRLILDAPCGSLGWHFFTLSSRGDMTQANCRFDQPSLEDV